MVHIRDIRQWWRGGGAERAQPAATLANDGRDGDALNAPPGQDSQRDRVSLDGLLRRTGRRMGPPIHALGERNRTLSPSLFDNVLVRQVSGWGAIVMGAVGAVAGLLSFGLVGALIGAVLGLVLGSMASVVGLAAFAALARAGSVQVALLLFGFLGALLVAILLSL